MLGSGFVRVKKDAGPTPVGAAQGVIWWTFVPAKRTKRPVSLAISLRHGGTLRTQRGDPHVLIRTRVREGQEGYRPDCWGQHKVLFGGFMCRQSGTPSTSISKRLRRFGSSVHTASPSIPSPLCITDRQHPQQGAAAQWNSSRPEICCDPSGVGSIPTRTFFLFALLLCNKYTALNHKQSCTNSEVRIQSKLVIYSTKKIGTWSITRSVNNTEPVLRWEIQTFRHTHTQHQRKFVKKLYFRGNRCLRVIRRRQRGYETTG